MSLKEYRRKRNFKSTPEPTPKNKSTKRRGHLQFVVQKHAATRTHYDFRLELKGTLKSWAVPKGPSLTSQDPRLAVYVEDHPLEYGSFEGAIPKGNYGAGTVMIWDAGTYVERNSKGRADSEEALQAGLARGHITFILEGKKLRGEFALVKLKNRGADDKAWLLIKKHDAAASRVDILRQDRSVVSGRSMEQIAEEAIKRGDIWLPGKGPQKKLKRAAIPRAPKRVVRSPSVANAKAMPRGVRPMEPVSVSQPPEEAGWIFEPFGAGPRALAEIESTRVRLHSRLNLPFEKKYPAIVESLKKLGHDAILDGEIIREGKTYFFSVSDLLFYEGRDLRDLPLRQRKQILSRISFPKLLQLAPSANRISELGANPSPSVVAKRAESLYLSGISREWLRLRAKSGRRAGASSAISEQERPPLTHVDKVFWPQEGYTKGDLIKYYDEIAEVILPYLKDRPQSLHRQPDGLRNAGFFHKDMSSFMPRRIETVRIFSGSAQKTINYALCQDRWSLLYLVNLGCIELNPWLSRRENLDHPDLVVIDLDPDGNDFREVVKVAREVYRVLSAVGAKSYCKTSGASGLHICVPTGGRFDYDTGRIFAEMVCRIVHEKLPELTSVERNPAKRKKRIYLDFLQNRRAQTLAAPYCVRPRPKATVSAPLKWSEVKPGLDPERFTIKTMARRLSRVGDLWRPLLNSTVDLEACMKRLSKRFHI